MLHTIYGDYKEHRRKKKEERRAKRKKNKKRKPMSKKSKNPTKIKEDGEYTDWEVNGATFHLPKRYQVTETRK